MISDSSAKQPHESNTWSATDYNKTASFVYSPQFANPVLDLLEPRSGEKIIDFGCGSGELTLQLEKAVGPHGVVVGTDASESMINKARSNGLKICFISNIQAIEFPSSTSVPWSDRPFDAVFTNATLHWCKRDPAGVLKSVKKVLRQGGRFVGEFGGFGNCIGVRGALHRVLRQRGYDPMLLDPWYFPSVEEYKSFLESENFEVKHVSLIPRPTPLASSLRDWLYVFCRNSFLASVNDKKAEDIIQEVERICAVDCRDASGKWTIMYTRLRFKAILIH